MKKKINYYLAATALFVAIATMISMTVINYYLFQKQVKEDLQVMAETIESTGILKQDIDEIPQIDEKAHEANRDTRRQSGAGLCHPEKDRVQGACSFHERDQDTA